MNTYYQTINFTNSIWIFDNFIEDKALVHQLKSQSDISTTIEGQDHYHLTYPQQLLLEQVTAVLLNYCNSYDIDYQNLVFNNLQKGYLERYDQTKVNDHLYEPHHDIAEDSYITAIYYIDSDFDETKWVGGELAIYDKLSFVDYPGNTANILPKSNRLIIFPGFLVHRVKPYFGTKPRTTLVMGWGVKNSVKNKVINI